MAMRIPVGLNYAESHAYCVFDNITDSFEWYYQNLNRAIQYVDDSLKFAAEQKIFLEFVAALKKYFKNYQQKHPTWSREIVKNILWILDNL